MDGDADRDFYLVEQVNKEGSTRSPSSCKLVKLRLKVSVMQDKPIEIALIYPSADTSDFWHVRILPSQNGLDQLGIE